MGFLKPLRIKDLSQDRVEKLLARNIANLDDVRKTVSKIIADVKSRGDEAVIEYTRLYDHVLLDKDGLNITREEMEKAYNSLSENIIEAMETVYSEIREVCLRFIPKDRLLKPKKGLRIWVLWRPLKHVGIYVPGGANTYPSTVLMTVTPAKVAGVEKITVCTPPRNAKPEVLAAMRITGVDEAFRIGGAQAIAAMAYGTETVPKVEKIAGPGGLYVETAKRMVYGDVGIDLPAGPSEIAVLADGSADPMLVAIDLLSQAEHPCSSAVLVTTSERLALEVLNLVENMADSSIIESFRRGGLFIAEDLEEAMDFLNMYAPEHLEVVAENLESVLSMLRNAGTVFLGPLTPVALGDYATGVSHVLPTGGAARFCSGLTPLNFLKVLTVQMADTDGFKSARKAAEVLAGVEGFKWHRMALKAREGLL